MYCILSGDFNTEVGRGWRSSKLAAMMSEMGLTVCNVNDDESMQNHWTFKSCLGALRRLDYIMLSDTLNFQNSGQQTYWIWGQITVQLALLPISRPQHCGNVSQRK